MQGTSTLKVLPAIWKSHGFCWNQRRLLDLDVLKPKLKHIPDSIQPFCPQVLLPAIDVKIQGLISQVTTG